MVDKITKEKKKEKKKSCCVSAEFPKVERDEIVGLDAVPFYSWRILIQLGFGNPNLDLVFFVVFDSSFFNCEWNSLSERLSRGSWD